MEDAVDAIVVSERATHQIARDVKDNQSLQIFQLGSFLDIADEVVSQVELHQTLQVLKAVETRDLVVFE